MFKHTITRLTIPKPGSIYHHKKLGYYGAVLYNLPSQRSTVDESNKPDFKDVNLLCGLFLHHEKYPRQRMPKYMKTIMVYSASGDVTDGKDGTENGKENESNQIGPEAPDYQKQKMSLPGLDILKAEDALPVVLPELSETDYYLKDLFFEKEAKGDDLVPREENIEKWRNSYHKGNSASYCNSFRFEEDSLIVLGGVRSEKLICEQNFFWPTIFRPTFLTLFPSKTSTSSCTPTTTKPSPTQVNKFSQSKTSPTKPSATESISTYPVTQRPRLI